MGDAQKTKKQLLDELDLLRNRIAAMESQGPVAVNWEEKEHYFIQDVRLLSRAAIRAFLPPGVTIRWSPSMSKHSLSAQVMF